MFGLGISEIVVILVIALIFIGPKKLPELARGLGKGLKEFQNAAKGIQDSLNNPTPSDTNSDTKSDTTSTPQDQPAAQDSEKETKQS